MKLEKVIPQVFYSDIQVGLKLFVAALGFTTVYKEETPPFYIVERDGVTLMLLENDEYARKDRPQLRIQTDDIDALYAEVSANASDMLHPNGKKIKTQPWGLKEFALLDASNVCVIVQQPIK